MLKRFIVTSIFVGACFFSQMLNGGQIISSIKLTTNQVMLQDYLWCIQDKTIGLYAALITAIEKEHNFVLEQLLERYSAEIEIDKPDQDGRTLLFRAVSSKNLDAVEILLDNSANPNLLDSKQHSPLQHAVVNKLHEIIIALLTYGADPDLPNDAQNFNSCRLLLESYVFKYADRTQEIKDLIKAFDAKKDQEE